MAKILKRIHPTDHHVGARIRTQRLVKGLSQSALASAIGVTFQQLQKYENGSNRVSASKLFDIAQTLDIEVADFFTPQQLHDTGGTINLDQLTKIDLGIARELLLIQDGPFKSAVLRLLRAVGGRDHEQEADDPGAQRRRSRQGTAVGLRAGNV